MSEELITPENLSKELLKAVLDASYTDAEIDSDGDVWVRDACGCLVVPNGGSVQLLAYYRLKPETDRVSRLECANQINDRYIVVRAAVTDADRLVFDYTVPVAGGITKKAFVLALRRFCSITAQAVADLSDDMVE